MSVFMCHQQDGRLCAGWCGVHDMQDAIGLRIAVMHGFMSREEMEEVWDYRTSVPLFDSGAEAAQHGLAAVDAPGPDAGRVIAKLRQRSS